MTEKRRIEVSEIAKGIFNNVKTKYLFLNYKNMSSIFHNILLHENHLGNILNAGLNKVSPLGNFEKVLFICKSLAIFVQSFLVKVDEFILI